LGWLAYSRTDTQNSLTISQFKAMSREGFLLWVCSHYVMRPLFTPSTLIQS